RANNKVVLALTSFLLFYISSVVIATVLPFFFAELSLAGPLLVSSGGAFVKNWDLGKSRVCVIHFCMCLGYEENDEGKVEVKYETLGDLVQRFHDHTQAIPVHRIQVIVGVQREQGHRIVGVESAVTALTERVAELERDNRRLRGTASVGSQRVDRVQRGMKMPNTRSGASMTHEEVEELVARRVAEEMKAHEAARNLETLFENGDEREI
nr:hypothetical protein [Tanacetum cinerariifolium]